MDIINDKVVVLRARKGVPGVGRKIARHFNANEVTCGYRPKRKVRDGAVVINYGRSEWPIWYADTISRGVRILNQPDAVGVCVNKLSTLKILQAHYIPCLEFATDKLQVKRWFAGGSSVIARSILTGKQGKGVSIIHPSTFGTDDSVIPEAPLYTKFYDKTHEFRVHVVNGQVIDLVQKKRLGKKKREARGIEVDELVRNHKRGWIFAHNDLICDTGGGRDVLEKLAVDTCNAIGLDFGGIDILAKYDDLGRFVDAVVCEANSAPGMSSPTTFKRYMDAFARFL